MEIFHNIKRSSILCLLLVCSLYTVLTPYLVLAGEYNPYVQIRLNSNIWLSLQETHTFDKLELGNNKILEDSVTFFEIYDLTTSSGSLNFTSDFNNTRYDLQWTPSRTAYLTYVTGNIDDIYTAGYILGNKTLYLELSGTGSASIRVYWENLDSDVKVTFSNSTQVDAYDYEGTNDYFILPFVFSSDITISIVDTSGAPEQYYMSWLQFSFEDLDSNDVESNITWTLYNGSDPLTYSEGDQTLVNQTTYNMKVYYRSININSTDIDIDVYGNTTYTFYLQMKDTNQTITDGYGSYVAFSQTITSITIVRDGWINFTFTVECGTANNIVVAVRKDIEFVEMQGSGNLSYVYSSTYGYVAFLHTATTNSYELNFPEDDYKSSLTFRHFDRDSNRVDEYVTWSLYNDTDPVTYQEGNVTLTNGTTYTLNTLYGGYQINQSLIAIDTYGNSTYDVYCEMKEHISTTHAYISFNVTLTSLTVNSETTENLTFTTTLAEAGSHHIVVKVPYNATYIERNNVEYDQWNYVDPYIIIYIEESTVYEIIFADSISWNDDFNDGSYTANWTLLQYGTLDAVETEHNGYLNLTLTADGESGSFTGIYLSTGVNCTNIDIQVDCYIPTSSGEGQVMIGDRDALKYNFYQIIYSREYGGTTEVWRRQNGTYGRRLTQTWDRHHSQLRIKIEDNSTITFYENDVEILSEDCTWLFSTGYGGHEDRMCNISLWSKEKLEDSQVLFDNFFYVINGTRNVYTITSKPSDASIWSTVIPLCMDYDSGIDLDFVYQYDMNISYYVILDTGFDLVNWTYTNSTGDFDDDNNPYFHNITEDANMTCIISLNSGYRLLNMTAFSYGLNVDPDYGIHAYALNDVVNLNSTPIFLEPPQVYPEFKYWLNVSDPSYWTWENCSIYSTSANTTLTITDNITIGSYCVTYGPTDTWQIRSMTILPDTPTAPPLDGSNYDEILDDITGNFTLPNGTNLINYIGVRCYWAFNSSVFPEIDLYIEEDNYPYQPTLEDVEGAIDFIHAQGMGVILTIPEKWMDTQPSGWDWNTSPDATFWSEYWNDVLEPVATMCEDKGVEILCISAELGSPSDISDPLMFTSRNDEWNTLISNTRNIYSGLVTNHINGPWENTGAWNIGNATYISNLDFLVIAQWVQSLSNDDDFVAWDVADGWYSCDGYAGRNILQWYQNIYEALGVKIQINCGYANAYGGLAAPWSGAGGYRDDRTQWEAWRGTLWAFQPQEWCMGIDFERYNQEYGRPSYYTEVYFSTTIRALIHTQEICKYELNLTTSLQSYLSISVSNLDVTLDNADVSNYLFVEEKYYDFTGTWSCINGVEYIDVVSVRFSDGLYNYTMQYDYGTTGNFSMYENGDKVYLRKISEANTSTTLTLKFSLFLTRFVFDSINVNFKMWSNNTFGIEYGWKSSSLYCTVYNLGGLTNHTSSGGAGRLTGGDYFELYAYNNSWSRTEIIYRYLQRASIGLALKTSLNATSKGAGSGVTKYQIGNFTFGMDYYHNGSWQTGWKCVIESVFAYYDPAAKTVQYLRVNWYYKDVFVKFDQVSCWLEDGQTSVNQTMVDYTRVNIDFWFNSENYSSIVGGRVSPYYLGMTKADVIGLSWTPYFYDNGVPDGYYYADKESSVFIELTDDNGDTIYSPEITMCKFYAQVSRNASYTTQGYQITNIDNMDYTTASDRLEGIDTPMFTEPQVPILGYLSGFMTLLTGFFTTLTQELTTAFQYGTIIGFTGFVYMLDRIAEFFGVPNLFTDMLTTVTNFHYWFNISMANLYLMMIAFFDAFVVTVSKGITFISTFIDIVKQVFVTIFSFLDGSYTGGIQVWNDLGMINWLILACILYPMYLFYLWDEKGIDPVIRQLTFIKDVFMFFFQILMTIADYFLKLITGIIEAIPIVE